MTKYIFAKRTMYVFKREDGPFDESVINSIDPRFITEGRCIPINAEPKDEPVLPVEPAKDPVVADPKVDMDLNNDGKVDKKDVSIAAKVMRKVRTKKRK